MNIKQSGMPICIAGRQGRQPNRCYLTGVGNRSRWSLNFVVTSTILTFSIAACYLMAAKAVADDSLTGKLSDAIDALDRRDNHCWTPSFEGPEGPRFRLGPTEGSNERDRSMLSIQELKWGEDGWPVGAASAPIAREPSSENPVPTEWVDPKTGHRIVRLSEEAGSASLYFHQNAYSPDGTKLLIATPSGLSTVDLRTRELQLVVPRRGYSMGGSSGVEVGRRTRHVYYSQHDRQGVVLRATHLDSRETRDVARLPFGASFCGVNADETSLLGTIRDRSPRGDRRFGQFGRSLKFFTANIKTGEINTFHPSSDWLNHAQCSPTDPQLALFCHEGPWHEVDRIWTIRMGSDEAKLMHRRQQEYEIAGHEFFSHDGQWVWYDLQTPRAAEFWLAGVNVKTGERICYRIAREQWSVHYNISPDGRLFAGDGGGPESVANQTPLPEKKRLNPPRNGQWIYLFRPREQFEPATISGEPARSGRVTAERLVDLSQHDYSLEPNVTFTPDGKWIVFRSNMHGERHVYAVRVDRDTE